MIYLLKRWGNGGLKKFNGFMEVIYIINIIVKILIVLFFIYVVELFLRYLNNKIVIIFFIMEFLN